MAQIESSPSVRRSNSYRVALRKSGVAKEYIEELDQMLADASVISNPTNESAANEKSKKSLFRRNYRAVGNKRNASTTTALIAESETQAICINSIDTHSDSSGEDCQSHEITPETANRDKHRTYDHQVTLQEISQQSTCSHLLCLICCCNYCIFLPSSLRARLDKESPSKID